MKNFIKIASLVLALVMSVAMIASCTSSTPTNTPASTPTSTPEGTPEATPTAQKGNIVVGYTIYAPMNFIDEKTNELVGFDTDLAKAVFEELGYNVIFKEIIWDQKYTELEAGTIDCIWNGFTSNGEDNGKSRSEYVDFSYNYMINKQVVVASNETASTITSAESLKGLVGSAEKGSIGYDYLGGFEGAITKDAKSQLEALQDLKLGGCKFVVLDEQLAKSYVGKGEYENYQIIEALSSDIEYYAIGFKKGSELTAKVNSTLEAFATSGKLTEIASNYAVENAVVTDFSDQKN